MSDLTGFRVTFTAIGAFLIVLGVVAFGLGKVVLSPRTDEGAATMAWAVSWIVVGLGLMAGGIAAAVFAFTYRGN